MQVGDTINFRDYNKHQLMSLFRAGLRGTHLQDYYLYYTDGNYSYHTSTGATVRDFSHVFAKCKDGGSTNDFYIRVTRLPHIYRRSHASR